ncbi:hypothetical protein FRC09_006759 [Ceratobasidium sp. 395]|nr:hypothetical protein FRC09_006759 [Ceratobasidium sp. 395]
MRPDRSLTASASFSYRDPPQPPIPGAAPPVPPPPAGTLLMLDRKRPAPPTPEFEYAGGPSQQAVLANILSQRIDQVDQLRVQLAHSEARIASLSARSDPSVAPAQAEARAEAAEARLAAIKDGWRGVKNYLDMRSRREVKVGVPPSVPGFGAGPTSPYSPSPPVPPNVPNRVGPNTFPALTHCARCGRSVGHVAPREWTPTTTTGIQQPGMAGPNASTTTRPRQSSDPSAAAVPAGTRAGLAGAKSDGAVEDLEVRRVQGQKRQDQPHA